MSLRKVQSFPNLDSDGSSPLSNQPGQSFVPKLEDLHHLHGSRISADRLFKILDGSMLAQKMGMKLAIDSINPTLLTISDRKFISCFLDSTVLLLDACDSIKQRLRSIRSRLDSISVGLRHLETEPEPNRALLQQAAAALESSRLRDKRHYTKMEKCVSKMRTFNEKLNSYAVTSESSRELHRALRGALAMAIFAVGVLCSATSVKSFANPSARDLKVEPRSILLSDQPSGKGKRFQKKAEKTASMEELASTDLASQSLLRLVSAWQKGGSSSLRRMAVRAVAGELVRRKEVLEKTLPLLEDKIEEFYQQIVAVKISIFGLLPKSEEEEEEVEGVGYYGCEERQLDGNLARCQRGVGLVRVRKVSASCSLGRIRPPRCIGFAKNSSVKPAGPLDM